MYKNNKLITSIIKTGGGVNKSSYFNTLSNLTTSSASLEQGIITGFQVNGVDIGSTACAYYEDYTISGSINFSVSPYAGCIKIVCLLIGGGGGGGDRGNNWSGNIDSIGYTNLYAGSGSAGASGSCASAQFTNPTGILTYTVGAGSAFRSGNFALAGGDTSFTFQSQTVIAYGGNGGLRGSDAQGGSDDASTNVNGGTGRGFTNGTTNFGGNNGVQGGTGKIGPSHSELYGDTPYSAMDSTDKIINSPWGSIQTISSNYGKSGVGSLATNQQPNPRLSSDASAGSFNGRGGLLRIYYFY